MARSSSAVKPVRPWYALTLVGVVLVLLQGCSRSPAPNAEQFVGKWRSSRLASLPLTMSSNGEWEIKGEGDADLQFGVWRVEGQRMLWTIRIDGRVIHDVNTILKVEPQRFELREADGSITQFNRLD